MSDIRYAYDSQDQEPPKYTNGNKFEKEYRKIDLVYELTSMFHSVELKYFDGESIIKRIDSDYPNEELLLKVRQLIEDKLNGENSPLVELMDDIKSEILELLDDSTRKEIIDKEIYEVPYFVDERETVPASTYDRVKNKLNIFKSRLSEISFKPEIEKVNEAIEGVKKKKQETLKKMRDNLTRGITDDQGRLPSDVFLLKDYQNIMSNIDGLISKLYYEDILNEYIPYLQSRIDKAIQQYNDNKDTIVELEKEKDEIYNKVEELYNEAKDAYSTMDKDTTEKYSKLYDMIKKEYISIVMFYSKLSTIKYYEAVEAAKADVAAFRLQCNFFINKHSSVISDLHALSEIKNMTDEDIVTRTTYQLDNEDNYKNQIIEMISIFIQYGVESKDLLEYAKNRNYEMDSEFKEKIKKLNSTISKLDSDLISEFDLYRCKRLLKSVKMTQFGLSNHDKEELLNDIEYYINELSAREKQY